jgi:uncharacterized protein YjbI with pentapeptide repeats
MSRDVVWLIVLATGLLVVAVGLFIAVPDWVVDEKVFEPDRAVDETKARTDARTAALALMAGLGAAVATIFAGRTYFLTRRGQLSERQATAIEQLHSDEEGIRMAGIAALERIAFESPNDHARIMELLAHFLRNRDPREDATPPADVQAACRALVERRVVNDRSLVLDFTGADLRGTNLARAVLRGAVLRGTQLDGAVLETSDLRGSDLTEARAPSAQLRGARLDGAIFRDADLTTATLDEVDARRADFRQALLDSATLQRAIFREVDMRGVLAPFVALDGADARGADFRGADCRQASARGLKLRDASASDADFSYADLGDANMSRASLSGANLTGANLTGANLTGADLTGADLTEAQTDGAVGITQAVTSQTSEAD